MRRALAFFRRSVSAVAMATCLASLLWLIRTSRQGDFLRIENEYPQVHNEVVFAYSRSIDIASRRGAIELWVHIGPLERRAPIGWRLQHSRTDASFWTPGAINTPIADNYDLVVDGVQSLLSSHSIGCRLYIANDGLSAFGQRIVPDPTGDIAFVMQLPHWLIAIVACAVFVLAIRPDWRARRRRSRGLCVRCGYDLRASPEACPECGDKPRPRGDSSVVTASGSR